MQVAVSRMIASVGLMIFGSSRCSTRTSPGVTMTTPRTVSPDRSRLRMLAGFAVSPPMKPAASPWWQGLSGPLTRLRCRLGEANHSAVEGSRRRSFGHWWSRRIGCGEGAKQVPDQSTPPVWCGVCGGGDDAGVGHEQDDELFGDEVGAQLSGGLGAIDDLHEAVVGLDALDVECPGSGEGHGEDVGEAAVGGLHGADGLDVAREGAVTTGRGRLARRLWRRRSRPRSPRPGGSKTDS